MLLMWVRVQVPKRSCLAFGKRSINLEKYSETVQCLFLFIFLLHQVSCLKMLLPCLSSVTHTMLALCRFLGTEFEIAAAAAVACCGLPNASHSLPHLHQPSLLNEWMTRLGLVLTGVWWWWWWWWWSWCPWTSNPPPVPEKSSQEKNQEFWGWWGRSPDLSQWTSSKSKMYRTRIFLCLFSVWEMRFFLLLFIYCFVFLFFLFTKG